MNLTLIINPFASSVTQRARVVIQQALGAKHDLEVIETTKRGHAIRLAHGASVSGTDAIIALGGDGTINEVANGVLGSQTAIVPLPGGSTNVFARALGYPNDPIEATTVLLQALDSWTNGASKPRPASVGMANGRAFLFHVGAGFDAAVVERVEKRGPLKRYLGHPLFVASTVMTWVRDVDRKSPWFDINAKQVRGTQSASTASDQSESEQSPYIDLVGTERQVEGAFLAVALNCNPYTFLGGRSLSLAPEAGLDRPLSVVSLTSLTLPSLSVAGFDALRGDGVSNRPNTEVWDGITEATLMGHRPFPYQIDGENLPPTTRLVLESRPDAIRVIAPIENSEASGPNPTLAWRQPDHS